MADVIAHPLYLIAPDPNGPHTLHFRSTDRRVYKTPARVKVATLLLRSVNDGE